MYVLVNHRPEDVKKQETLAIQVRDLLSAAKKLATDVERKIKSANAGYKKDLKKWVLQACSFSKNSTFILMNKSN